MHACLSSLQTAPAQRMLLVGCRFGIFFIIIILAK
jgi:hypothetical protein